MLHSMVDDAFVSICNILLIRNFYQFIEFQYHSICIIFATLLINQEVFICWATASRCGTSPHRLDRLEFSVAVPASQGPSTKTTKS